MPEKENWWPKRRIYYWGPWRRTITEDSKRTLSLGTLNRNLSLMTLKRTLKRTLSLRTLKRTLSLKNLKRALSLWNLKRSLRGPSGASGPWTIFASQNTFFFLEMVYNIEWVIRINIHMKPLVLEGLIFMLPVT